MKAALRDARVAAAVERGRKPKPKRAVTAKPVKPSKYPRLGHDSAMHGAFVRHRKPQPETNAEKAAAKAKSDAKARAHATLPERVKSPGKRRRLLRLHQPLFVRPTHAAQKRPQRALRAAQMLGLLGEVFGIPEIRELARRA